MTNEQLGQMIDTHSYLNTTSQTLAYARRHHTDAFIVDSLEYCSRGNKEALLKLIDKHNIKKDTDIERSYIEDKDIINELMGVE